MMMLEQAPQSETNQTALIDMRQLGVRRNGRWLIRGVDLKVEPGEIVTLIGPNGSGKTTAIRAAIGLIEPEAGNVTRAPGLRIGYVPQKVSINSTLPLSVSRLMNLTKSHSRAALDQALELTGISHLAQSDVHRLSGGEFQRALLARALLSKPQLLVLDEPVQGVDFAGQVALYELIVKVREETGCGILLVSHDLHVVMAQTDSVLCLNGHVCCSGSPQSVAANPEYIRLFGRQAADTLAIYRHHHDHTHLPDGRVQHADGSTSDHCHPDDGHHDHAG